MKKLAVLIIAIALNACQTPATTGEVVETQAVSAKPLAWGKDHADWDKWLTEAVNKSALQDTVKTGCKTLKPKPCLIQAISIMAVYESSLKPKTNFTEDFEDSTGAAVISRGLMQISQESANLKPYSCGITKAKQLNDPKTNLECAVKIAVKWLNQDKVFFGEPKMGLGRYWSVGRSVSKSNPAILEYLGKL